MGLWVPDRVSLPDGDILVSDVVVLARSVYPKTVKFIEHLFLVDLGDVVLRFVLGEGVGFSLGGEIWVPDSEVEFGNFIAHELGHEADRRLWGYYFTDRGFSEEIALFSEAMAKAFESEGALPPYLAGFGRRMVHLAEEEGWRRAKEFTAWAVFGNTYKAIFA